jgi:quercetin dioxygenase-like cupin family protein
MSTDLVEVLKSDGLISADWDTVLKYQNISTINLEELRKDLGMGSWAVRVAYNELFGGVVIQQLKNEGNRRHYHPDADENWVILDGEWEWWIDGQGYQKVNTGDIIIVPNNVWHQIKCISDVGARYAITRPDVDHVYE